MGVPGRSARRRPSLPPLSKARVICGLLPAVLLFLLGSAELFTPELRLMHRVRHLHCPCVAPHPCMLPILTAIPGLLSPPQLKHGGQLVEEPEPAELQGLPRLGREQLAEWHKFASRE